MPYTVKDVFFTLQGEGRHAGRPSVFVRFAGCNLWTGLDRTRERDAARHGAQCPVWCDTDFFRGQSMTARELATRIGEVMRGPDPFVVFTGGEPMLQLDAALLSTVRAAVPGVVCAIETNGSIPVKIDLDWICVSPKHRPEFVLQRTGHELKVVYPSYNPHDYDGLASGFSHRYVSPEATPEMSDNRTRLVESNIRAAARFCLEYPKWKLSLQTHKLTGLP